MFAGHEEDKNLRKMQLPREVFLDHGLAEEVRQGVVDLLRADWEEVGSFVGGEERERGWSYLRRWTLRARMCSGRRLCRIRHAVFLPL